MEEGRRAHRAIVSWACTALCLVSCAAAFSQGASPSACTDMMPRHLRAQLHSPSNNYVTVHTNMSFYSPGDKVPGKEQLLTLRLSPAMEKAPKQLLVLPCGSSVGRFSS